jgi:lysophospholipase L1-like esterase
MTEPLSTRQKCLTVAVSLGVGLALAFGLGEVWLRVHAPASIRLMHDRIILPKNQIYLYQNTGLRGCDPRIVHHKNSLGFRGAEPPTDFADALTVVAVGGSTTECFYLSDGHSWPELVGTELQPSFQHFWLNNAGLDGHSTFGHLILMKDVLTALHPKVVLFLVGVNDMGRDDLVISDRDFLKANRDRTVLRKILRTLGEKSRMLGWLENLARSFSAWRHGLNHHTLDLKQVPQRSMSDLQAQEILRVHQAKYLDSYRKRLEQLVQLSRDAGIQPVLITQPALYGKGQDDLSGMDLETIDVGGGLNGRAAWQVLQLYNDCTRSVGRARHVPVIDLANELGKTSRYFYDFYHFTNAGSEAAADIIAVHLRAILARLYPSFVSHH